MNNSSWSFLQINGEQFYKAKQRMTHANHLCYVMCITRLMPGTIETTEEHAHKSEHIGETNTPIRAHRRNKNCNLMLKFVVSILCRFLWFQVSSFCNTEDETYYGCK
jgi:hypothetical protein